VRDSFPRQNHAFHFFAARTFPSDRRRIAAGAENNFFHPVLTPLPPILTTR